MDDLDEKIARALRSKAEDFPPDSTPRHFLRSHALEAAKAVRAAITDAGFVLMPKDQILRKMSHEEFTEMVARIRFRENADG
jgi:hypothetical protein